MKRLLLAGILVLLALRPGAALAQGPPDPPLLNVAETVSVCMSNGLHERLIGPAWVEPTDEGYRVAMQLRYPPPWVGPVFAWVDLTRVPGQVELSPADQDNGYAYAVVSHDYTYIGHNGSHREPQIAFWGARCMQLLVWQP